MHDVEAVGVIPGTIKPEYHFRFPNMEDFAHMPDTMFETIAFDCCYTTGFFTMPGELRAALSSPNPGMSSMITRRKASYARQLTSINASIHRLH